MISLDRIPFFGELESSQNILIAGAGGGFDIYCGIPLYFHLKNQGKNVTIANLSFTWLSETNSEIVFPNCYRIRGRDNDLSGRNYFPEKYLSLWFSMQGEYPNIYAFRRSGVNPVKGIYKFLIKEHNIDTIVLVDGGTDSLMFGDEEGLGTPQEDICSMAAVYQSGVKKQFLLSIGFGIDHYHGVSHFRFLENVAALIKNGGYLGMFQILKEMEAAEKYVAAINFVNEKMTGMESIVSNSIISALAGNYGNTHATSRTKGSELWINPLMTIYWCFNLRNVIRKNEYFDLIKDSNTMSELNGNLSAFRSKLNFLREGKQIPI